MEEELLRRILQEIQSQSGTSWQDVLLLLIPALVGLVVGISGAAVAIYTVKRSSDGQVEGLRLTAESDYKKISLERRLDLRRERYMELQDALAEFIAALDSMLVTHSTYAQSIFESDEGNAKTYKTLFESTRDEFETVRSSGRLSKSGFKVGDQKIGDLARLLAQDARNQYLAMIRSSNEAVSEFLRTSKAPSYPTGYWPKEDAIQRTEIAKRTHQISEMIEERISLTD